MNLKFLSAAFAGGALALCAGAANAVININFDAVTTFANVDGFYNGGTDSAGASGPNLGVGFVNFTTTTGFGETSQPNLAYVNSATGVIDVAAGFDGRIAFTQGLFQPGSIDVYSGLDGTGTLLASASLPASNPLALAPYSLAFSGVAESVVFTEPFDATFGIDDLQLGVPEPAAWTLILIGFGGLGAALRARGKTALG
jgi:hypothetical protein